MKHKVEIQKFKQTIWKMKGQDEAKTTNLRESQIPKYLGQS